MEWPGSINQKKMFDRVLDVSFELEKKGYNKQLAEKMVLVYQEKGAEVAIENLIYDHGYTKQDAIDFVQKIDRSYVGVNRQILFFYLGIALLLGVFVYFGLINSFFIVAAISALLLMRRLIIIYKFVRKNRFTPSFKGN